MSRNGQALFKNLAANDIGVSDISVSDHFETQFEGFSGKDKLGMSIKG